MLNILIQLLYHVTMLRIQSHLFTSQKQIKIRFQRIKDPNSSKAKDIFDLDISLFKKHCADPLKPVSHLVNLSIKTSEFPENFKTAVVTPIVKSGVTEEASSYRPISNCTCNLKSA